MKQNRILFLPLGTAEKHDFVNDITSETFPRTALFRPKYRKINISFDTFHFENLNP